VFDIACAADDRFVRPLAVLLRSLGKNHSSCPLRIHVVADGIGEADRSRLSAAAAPHLVEWLEADTRGLEDIFQQPHLTFSSLFRLKLPSLLDDVDRVLYLDSDTMVIRDLGPLVETDLGEAPVAAVRDSVFSDYRSPFWSTPEVEAIDGRRREGSYFNTGVALMNLAVWRRDNLEQEAFRRLNQNDLLLGDQCAMNAVSAGKWRELPARWNLQTQFLTQPFSKYRDTNDIEELVQARTDPALVHMTSTEPGRPWTGGNHPFNDAWFSLLDETAFGGWRPQAQDMGTTAENERFSRARLGRIRRQLRSAVADRLGPGLDNLTQSRGSMNWRRAELHTRLGGPLIWRVAEGPFKATRAWLPRSLRATLPPSLLLGTHHLELRPHYTALGLSQVQQMAFAGAKDPIAVVGMAIARPDAEIRVATDDSADRAIVRRLAESNGVADQVRLETLDELFADFPDEGYVSVSGHTAVTRLLSAGLRLARQLGVLVECDDGVVPAATPRTYEMLSRLGPVRLIKRTGRDPADLAYPGRSFSEPERWMLVADHDESPQQWLWSGEWLDWE